MTCLIYATLPICLIYNIYYITYVEYISYISYVLICLIKTLYYIYGKLCLIYMLYYLYVDILGRTIIVENAVFWKANKATLYGRKASPE